MTGWELFINQLPQQMVNGLWLGSVYALFALGYTLVFGVFKELNLAHGGIFMWGAFIGLICVTDLNIPLWAALPLAMLGTGLLGVLLERLAYKPLRRLTLGSTILWGGFVLFLVACFRLFAAAVNIILGITGLLVMTGGFILDVRGSGFSKQRKSDYLSSLISTIGAGSIMVSLSQATFGAQQSRFPQHTFPSLVFQWGNVSISLLQIVIFLLSLLLMAGLSWYVFRTKTGRAMRAVAYNPRVAGLLGIHVDRIFVQTFFVSSALAGAAGVFHGLAFNAITPYMGAPVQLKGLTVIVLGGLGNIGGAVVGGFVVAILEVLSVAMGQSNFRDAIVFFLLFLMLLIRPEGLLGRKRTDKV